MKMIPESWRVARPGGFVGSGTTIIAAEMTARCCYAIEIDPAYVQVSIERWQTFTGKEATLECDGRSLNEIKRERDCAEPAKPLNSGIEAALTSNREVRANFAELAQQWRDLARQHQNLGNPPPQSN